MVKHVVILSTLICLTLIHPVTSIQFTRLATGLELTLVSPPEWLHGVVNYTVYDWSSIFGSFYKMTRYNDSVIALVGYNGEYALAETTDFKTWSIVSYLPPSVQGMSCGAGRGLSVVDNTVIITLFNDTHTAIITTHDLHNYTVYFIDIGNLVLWHEVVKLQNGSMLLPTYVSQPLILKSDDNGETWSIWLNVSRILGYTVNHVHDIEYIPKKNILLIAYGDTDHGVLIYNLTTGRAVRKQLYPMYGDPYGSVGVITYSNGLVYMGSDSFNAPPIIALDPDTLSVVSMIKPVSDDKVFVWDSTVDPETGVIYFTGYYYGVDPGSWFIPVYAVYNGVYARILWTDNTYSWMSPVTLNGKVAFMIDPVKAKYIVVVDSVKPTDVYRYNLLRDNRVNLGEIRYIPVESTSIVTINFTGVTYSDTDYTLIDDFESGESWGLPSTISSDAWQGSYSLEISAGNNVEQHVSKYYSLNNTPGTYYIVAICRVKSFDYNPYSVPESAIGLIGFIMYYNDTAYTSMAKTYFTMSNGWIIVSTPPLTVNSNTTGVRVYIYAYNGSAILVDAIYLVKTDVSDYMYYPSLPIASQSNIVNGVPVSTDTYRIETGTPVKVLNQKYPLMLLEYSIEHVTGTTTSNESSTSEEYTTITESTLVSIYMDENGTIYIRFGRIPVYNYSVTTVQIGWYNTTHIYVSYSGVYIYNVSELIPVVVYIYNGTTLKYVLNISDPSILPRHESLVYYVVYYNVSGFTNITYKIYRLPDNTLIYTGSMPPPPGNKFRELYSQPYLSWLATLIPLAILYALAGRGRMKHAGAGLVIYGVVLMILPYIGVYPPFRLALIPLSMLTGIILLFMTR